MIVTDFEIDHFRDGPPLRVLDLGNGLNVALVHSQGGRELLLNFIPATLYGRDWPSYHALGSAHAQLRLRTEQGVFSVERDADDDHGGALVVAPDGSHFSEGFIRDLVDGASPGNFREIFTFSLDRVSRQDESRILRIARFLRQRSPETAMELPGARADLRGPQRCLNELAELIGKEASKTNASAVKDKNAAPKDRGKIERELQKADSAVADGRQKLQHLVRELEETQCALALNRAHARLSEVDREIAELQPKNVVRETVSTHEGTMERLSERINDCRQQLKPLAEEKADLISQGKETHDRARASKLLPQIEAMLLHEKAMLKEEDALEQLKLNIENLEARLESERLQDASHADSGIRSANPRELARLDSVATRLRDAERQLEVAEQRLGHAESNQLSHGHAEYAAMDAVATPEDALSLHEAEQRVDELRQQLELDDQMHRMDSERSEIVDRIRRLHHQQLMPVGRVAVLGVLFAVGIAMVIWGMPFMHGGEVRWNIVTIGGALAILAAMVKFVADREASFGLHNERNRLAHVNHQLEALVANHAERGLDTEALVRQLELAESEVARLSTGFSAVPSVDEETSFTTLSVAASQHQLEEIRRRHQEVSQDWRDLLIELQLSPTLTPTHAREALADRAARAASVEATTSDTESRLRIARAELDRRKEWIKTLGGQTRQLAKELGHTPGQSLAENFDILRDTVVEHRERVQMRRQLSRALKRLRQKEAQVRQAGRRYAAQKKQAEDAARLKKEQDRVKRQLTSDRLKLLQRQRERLQEDIDELRARYRVEDKTPLAEFSDSDLEERLERQLHEQASLGDKVIQLSEKRGQLRAELGLKFERHLPVSTTSWAPIVNKTKALAEQLSAASASDEQLPMRQTHYYLNRAAGYLAILSGGQFQRLESPAKETLILVDQEGHSASLDRVRHEHFPNIYFSLWLARIEVYADRGIRLPMILEDPLKVTEGRRKKPLAKLLKQFGARGYQAVLVTDEPAHADLFTDLKVPVADLSQRELVAFEDRDGERSWDVSGRQHPTGEYSEVEPSV